MSDEKAGDRQYFKRLARATEDKKVQTYWFNMLIRRDLENWERRDIPDTKLRNMLKEEKFSNALLNYLRMVVTGQFKHCFWKPFLKSKDQWYWIDAIKCHFKEWVNRETGRIVNLKHAVDELLETAGPPWAETGNRFKKRVYDRSVEVDGSTKKQVLCLHLTRESVKDLHRRVLNKPDWEYPASEMKKIVAEDGKLTIV